MRCKFYFPFFLFFCSLVSAQNTNYSVLTIPENLKENASWEIQVVLGRAYSGSGGYKIELKLEDDDIYKIKNYLKNWPRASPNEISDEEFPKITNEFKENVLAQIKFAMDDKTFFKSLLKKHGLRDYKEF